jgi:hypothetical protein
LERPSEQAGIYFYLAMAREGTGNRMAVTIDGNTGAVVEHDASLKKPESNGQPIDPGRLIVDTLLLFGNAFLANEFLSHPKQKRPKRKSRRRRRNPAAR